MTTETLIEQYLDNKITIRDLISKVQPIRSDLTLDIATRFMAASLANPDIDDEDYNHLAAEALDAATALIAAWNARQ